MGVLLFGYDVSVIFLILVWCEFDDKNYDFDRVVLFVDLIWLKSIDFTGDLNDWRVVNRCILMCYFIIKYDVFGWVREKPYFIRAERCFECIFDDFWSKWKVVKCLILVGLLEVGIEVIFWMDLVEMSRKCWFYNGFVDRTDVPFLAIEHLF